MFWGVIVGKKPENPKTLNLKQIYRFKFLYGHVDWKFFGACQPVLNSQLPASAECTHFKPLTNDVCNTLKHEWKQRVGSWGASNLKMWEIVKNIKSCYQGHSLNCPQIMTLDPSISMACSFRPLLSKFETLNFDTDTSWVNHSFHVSLQTSEYLHDCCTNKTYLRKLN